MTQQVTGYKYLNINAAENSRNALRVHYLGGRAAGNPNGDGKPYTTTEWVSVEQGTFEGQSFFYFLGDYAPVLGQPQVFDIDIPEI